MKRIIKHVFISLFLFSLVLASNLTGKRANAEESTLGFDKNVSYDIYYQVSDCEMNRVDNVKILGTIKISNINFLSIQISSLVNRNGFIALDSIKAILPNGTIRPYRSIDTKTQ